MRPALPLSPIARGISLFVGTLTLIDTVADLRTPGLDATLWLFDLRRLPPALAAALCGLFSAVLVAHGVVPAQGAPRRAVTRAVALAGVLVALANTLGFWRLLWHHRLYAGFPLPASLGLAGLLTVVALGVTDAPLASPSKRSVAGTVGALAVLAPLAVMVAFGRTDYRRAADVIVVFGARTYADGRPSHALGDRVRTACELYRQGYARRMIFSGGPGDGDVSEPQAMRRLAMRLGVASDDIALDEQGLNTDATVRNTGALFAAMGARRVLVVSHAYHLPRVKLAYHRAGQEVFTVPAREQRLLMRMPYFMAREVAALWVYYGRSVTAA